MSADGTVTLTEAEYWELLTAYRELSALEAAGVDNWDGYDGAMAILEDGDDD